MEIAIFTKEVADCLQARGYKLIRVGGKAENIFFFEDDNYINIAIEEILSSLTLE